jgi:hypothetical protein
MSTGTNVAADAHCINIFLPQEVWMFVGMNPDK